MKIFLDPYGVTTEFFQTFKKSFNITQTLPENP